MFLLRSSRAWFLFKKRMPLVFQARLSGEECQWHWEMAALCERLTRYENPPSPWLRPLQSPSQPPENVDVASNGGSGFASL